MREIKFRAWHKTEKILCDIKTLTEEGAFLVGIKPGEDQIIPEFRCIIPAPPDGRFCKMDEIELMQFTGLLDKNGKEIYEGDIITSKLYEFNDGFCHDVYFNEAEFRVRWTMFRLSEVFEHSNSSVEIIGNIYENPELMNN